MKFIHTAFSELTANISSLLWCCRTNNSAKDEGCYVAPPRAFRELTKSYNHGGEKVDMSPCRCAYTKKTDNRGNVMETATLGEEVTRTKTPHGSSSYTPMPVEYRGITLRQLRAIYANIQRRCAKEGWENWEGKPLTPEAVTLYDINTYIVKPFTKASQASFVEALPSTCGTQPPRFFISHWWGEAFIHTLACLEQFVHDFRQNRTDFDNIERGGMTVDTPVWICLFANNQWKLDDAITIDPKESSFTRALETAENRVVSILDARGNVFTRVWCCFELYLTFTAQMGEGDGNAHGVWAVYTAHNHMYNEGLRSEEGRDAVGIISGGAPGEVPQIKSLRESPFPGELICMSRGITIETAEASMESDRTHILNSIAENKDLEADPPSSHVRFDKVNDAVRGAFAASMPALIGALNAGGKEWKATLDCLSKGVMYGGFSLIFDQFPTRLSSSQARDLVSHIPITCNGLDIKNANGEACEGAIEGMIEWIGKANTMKKILCTYCKVGNAEGGRDAGIRLAAALGASHHAKSIEWLLLIDTDLVVPENISEWSSALKTMTALKRLLLYRTGGIPDEEKSILKNATHASDVTFD